MHNYVSKLNSGSNPEEQMTENEKLGVTFVAATEGITYSVLVFMAASFASWQLVDFRPRVTGTYLDVISSTIWPLLVMFVFAQVHKVLQRALCKYGTKLSGGLLLLDQASSIAPGIALILAWAVDLYQRPHGGYNSWAFEYWIFISLIVADSIWEDLGALRRYNR
jgi:hypothetical protein